MEGIGHFPKFMVNVFLYGDIKDKSITPKLCRVLSKNGGVLYLSDEKAVHYGKFDTPEFMLYECASLNKIQSDKSIIIFKGKQTDLHSLTLSAGATAVLEKHNLSAVGILKGSKIPCISCGMSPRDTITLSSISDTLAALSIQRTVTDIYKNPIEPCDISVKLSGFCDGFTLLSISAVLILSGKLKNGVIEI